jgi:hypothetical protein
MTTQPGPPDETPPAAPFWTQTPEEYFGQTVIDPAIGALEELSRREAANPSAATRFAAGAIDRVEALEDKLEEKLQPLDQAMDRAVDKTLQPVFDRLDKSSLVDRILDWWLNLGKPKTDEGRVDAWIAEHPEEVRDLVAAVQRGEKSPAWATAFTLVFMETPRGQDADVERIARVETLILQRIGQGPGR